MRRGDVVIAADSGAGDYAGKPRPYVVVQADAFADLDSITVCLLTSVAAQSPTRILIEPSAENGLRLRSWVEADKIVTFRRARLSRVIGRLTNEEMAQLNAAILVFLGLAG
jgi:mRNA interferase MazF